MKTINEIVNTFITDLKRTKEYKEAWKSCNRTSQIYFDFGTKKFGIIGREISELELEPADANRITMDEELLLEE